MTNVWIDIMTGRFATYIQRALEESEYFDFMTLFRRVLENKTLMNFKLMIEEAHDLAHNEELDADFHDKVMRKTLPKISKVMEKLSIQITVEDMRTSSYVLHEKPQYTYMEMYWLFLAWRAFGEDGEVPAGFIYDAVILNGRETLRASHDEFANEPLFAMMLPKDKKRLSKRNKFLPQNGVDVVQFMLQRMDQKLLAVKEKSVMGKLSTAEAAEVLILH